MSVTFIPGVVVIMDYDIYLTDDGRLVIPYNLLIVGRLKRDLIISIIVSN